MASNIKYIDKDGKLVAAGSPEAAFVVNTNDPASLDYLKKVRKAAVDREKERLAAENLGHSTTLPGPGEDARDDDSALTELSGQDDDEKDLTVEELFPGIEPAVAEKLKAGGYESLADAILAEDDDLLKTKISKAQLKAVRAASSE